jgi:hypothetical protein
VTSRIYVEQIPIGESNLVCKEYHYLHRQRTGPQIAYGVWYRGIGIGVVHYAYPRWSKSPYPEAPSPLNTLECARVYIANLDRRGYPIGNEKGRRIDGLSASALALTMELVKDDWATKYPHLPIVTALVSWSDNTRHPGLLYNLSGWRCDKTNIKGRPKGANWIHGSARYNGQTTRHNYDDYNHDKSRWSVILDDSLFRNTLERAEGET